MLLIYRIRGLQSKPIPLLGLSAVRILTQRDKNHLSRCWKIPKKNHMIPRLNINLRKKIYWIPPRILFLGAFWKTRFPYWSSQPYGYFRYPLYIIIAAAANASARREMYSQEIQLSQGLTFVNILHTILIRHRSIYFAPFPPWLISPVSLFPPSLKHCISTNIRRTGLHWIRPLQE
jgi:hypothetical protein